MRGQSVDPPRTSETLEEPSSSAESRLQVPEQAPGDCTQDNVQRMQAELAEVNQALNQGKLKAETAEEELAQLLRKAEHASDAVKTYSSSAQKGLHQLLLAAEDLRVDETDPRSEHVQKLRADLRVFTDQLRESMKEISNLTDEVEELSSAYGKETEYSPEVESKADAK